MVPSYKGHLYPTRIIEEAVWLYFYFTLSFGEVEMRLARRGIKVTYETMGQGRLKFGQAYACALKRRRARPGDKWHLDEVVFKIKGKLCYLWRVVDQEGVVLDILVQTHRNTKAATRFSRTCSRA